MASKTPAQQEKEKQQQHKEEEEEVEEEDNEEEEDDDDVEGEDEEEEEDEEEGEDHDDKGKEGEGGEEDEEDDEDEDEDEEDEDEEPKLKYQRISSDAQEILKKDASSCMAVHSKFLALGTHWGVIHILDFYGYEIKKFTSHSATINELSIDNNGDYIASCSDDGKVVINALYSSETNSFSYKRPVKAVALDPEYSKKNSRQFATGGLAAELILNEKGWFSHKDTVLHAGEGTIHSIKWRGSLIAWANDVGVKIYDCTTNQRITFIERGSKSSPRPDMYHCCLCWKTDICLLIAWADTVQIALVKEKPRGEIPTGLPTRYVEILGMFQTDYFLCGIAPFNDYLVLLTYTEEITEQGNRVQHGKGRPAQRPEIRIVSLQNEEISSDALSVTGYEHYQAKDYRLEYLPQENIFYVVSPKDIVMAKPRDLDDHINWLLERERYEEALTAAEKNERLLVTHTVLEIGQKYLAYLISSKHIDEAAAKCPSILKDDAKLWEQWVYLFAKIHQLKAIGPYIPYQKTKLSRTVYEMVLANFLETQHDVFEKTIKTWPPDLYDIDTVTVTVEDSIKEIEYPPLMRTLARLYIFQGRYDKALHIYLKSKVPGVAINDVLELIKVRNLFDSVKDKIVLLMKFEGDEEKISAEEGSMRPAVQMLVSNTDRIPIPLVVSQLKENKRLLHIYLHALFKKDPHLGSDFHELQVELYAEYDYKMLLSFLRQSNYYPLEKALKVCEERNLVPEMVFILGRMGNNKQALNLIIEKLGDVQQAIEFAKEQNDEELWEDLIQYSLDKPDFITGLLQNVGSHVDPIKLIKRIPKGLKIPGLKDSLIKILQDYNLQTLLREGCKQILTTDCVDLMERNNKEMRRGILMTENTKCATSGRFIFGEAGKTDVNVVVFFCGHACLESSLLEITTKKGKNAPEQYFCPLCQNAQALKTSKKSSSLKVYSNSSLRD